MTIRSRLDKLEKSAVPVDRCPHCGYPDGKQSSKRDAKPVLAGMTDEALSLVCDSMREIESIEAGAITRGTVLADDATPERLALIQEMDVAAAACDICGEPLPRSGENVIQHEYLNADELARVHHLAMQTHGAWTQAIEQYEVAQRLKKGTTDE